MRHCQAFRQMYVLYKGIEKERKRRGSGEDVGTSNCRGPRTRVSGPIQAIIGGPNQGIKVGQIELSFPLEPIHSPHSVEARRCRRDHTRCKAVQAHPHSFRSRTSLFDVGPWRRSRVSYAKTAVYVFGTRGSLGDGTCATHGLIVQGHTGRLAAELSSCTRQCEFRPDHPEEMENEEVAQRVFGWIDRNGRSRPLKGR